MPELVLIRGLPGSGKTTLAKEKYPNHILVEADAWFELPGGYFRDDRELVNAHNYCMLTAECLLRQGKNVVVANTFVKRWEIAPYAAIAIRTDSFLIVETAHGEFDNAHGVYGETIEKMKTEWEEFTIAHFNNDF